VTSERAPRPSVDLARVDRAVEATCAAAGLSRRQAALELGIDPATLTRLRQGRKPDADTIVALLAFTGLAPAEVIAVEPRKAKGRRRVVISPDTAQRSTPPAAREKSSAH
jgi:transcriptional regulator with XRE-family HTH domain